MSAVDPDDGLPLGPDSPPEAVKDLQHRLAALGFDVADDEPGIFGPSTEATVRSFQASRGIRVDGECGRQTWAALVEAGYRLGDRLLYLRSPMLRGEDVHDLQLRLGALGFDAGRVDGIFGPTTASALADFQKNAGLGSDGICGPGTVDALVRVGAKLGSPASVAAVREREALRRAPRRLAERRIAVGETGGLAALADALSRSLSDAGATVLTLHHPDQSTHAREANEFRADAYVGLAVGPAGCATSFYAARGFESAGGRRLAELICAEVTAVLEGPPREPAGMRLAVLRETRMPATWCELGPPALVVARSGALVEGLGRALAAWVETPVHSEGSPQG
jgi:N-acetylmuramoyl-L-alanine amidase